MEKKITNLGWVALGSDLGVKFIEGDCSAGEDEGQPGLRASKGCEEMGNVKATQGGDWQRQWAWPREERGLVKQRGDRRHPLRRPRSFSLLLSSPSRCVCYGVDRVPLALTNQVSPNWTAPSPRGRTWRIPWLFTWTVDRTVGPIYTERKFNI